MKSRVVLAYFVGVVALTAAGCGSNASSGPGADEASSKRSAPEPASYEAKEKKKPRSGEPDYRFEACDENIDARIPNTSCGFALNAFYEYWRYGSDGLIDVYSPALGKTLSANCATKNGVVRCTTRDRGQARFPLAAVSDYTDEQAAAYARSGALGPSGPDHPGMVGPDDTSRSEPEIQQEEVAPPPYEDRIPNYDNGNGYPVRCADGTWSQSGGRQGACSHHGGIG